MRRWGQVLWQDRRRDGTRTNQRRESGAARKRPAFRQTLHLEPLEPRVVLALDPAPPGFLVDRPLDATGTIAVADEVDTFLVGLVGGQTATVLLTASEGLAPELELRDPSGELLGSRSAAAGQTALLQTIHLDVDGTYTVTVGGDGSTGRYDLQVLLGAAAELEPITGLPNDSLATAENLDARFVDLHADVDRGAVRGQLAGGLRPDAFGYSAVAVPYEFEDISRTGTVLLSEVNDDAVRLESEALAGFTFPFYGRRLPTLFVSSNGLITFGLGDAAADNTDLTERPPGPAIAVLWDDLDLGFGSEGGEVLWEVRGTGNDERLILQWNEVQYFPYFAFLENDTITFQAVLFADGTIQINYRDLAEAEELLASEGRTATVGIKDNGLQGERRLLLAYNSGPNDFVGSRQSLRIGTDLDSRPADTFDLYEFGVRAGQAVTLALDAALDDVLLELLDAAGTLLAVGTTADNVAQLINGYVAPGETEQEIRLLARVSPATESLDPIEYTLLVLRDAVFDRETNRSAALAQPGTTALGAISSRDRGEAILLADFPAIDSGGTDCFCEPPDSHAAVGPDHVVEVVNTAIAVFDKDGSLAMPPRELKDFFEPSLVAGEQFDFDPVIAYDDLAQRWVVAVLIGATAGAEESDLLYAISDTSDPTEGFTEQHRIDFGAISPGLFADFPKVGFNADAHVFTLNMFAPGFDGDAYKDVNIVAIDKSTVLDADTRTFSHFISERPGSSFTMAAASMHSAEPGDPLWFVEEATFGGGNRIRVVRMDDVLTPTPTYTDFNIRVTPYQFTPGAVQPGGIFRTNDPRISNADFRDGRLVAAHAVGIAGEATVRWYEFDVTGDVPQLIQEGNIDPGPGVHAYFPSIAINDAGDLGMTYLQSSATEFVSMYVAGQTAGSSPGRMATGALVKAGEKTYVGSRGGDYSGVATDPVTDTFWAVNEVVLTGPDAPLWSTWIGEFTVSDALDEDWYRLPVAAGDELRIETFTPFAGAVPESEVLDPVIALHAPDGRLMAVGDNGAADGRNALLILTAQESGIYRVQVYGRDETRGNYVLDVAGATPPSEQPVVRDTNPDNGVMLGTFPETLQVTFSEAILATSVGASDLVVGGVPAAGVRQVDGATFEFELDPNADRGDGSYGVMIAAGAVADLQHRPNAPYQASFQLDQTGPRILQTRWNGGTLPADRRLADGPLTFEAVLDEPLFVLGSARRGVVRPGSDDAFVTHRTSGEVFYPRRIAIDMVQSTFTAEFDPLPEGDYTLTLVSGAMAFEDAVGNPLDGEPLGEAPDGTPTGDGTPGGNYTVDFLIDRDTLVIEDFERVRPLGSLVYSSAASGLLSPAGDVDAFAVRLHAGQTISAVVTPHDPAATLTVRLNKSERITATAAGAAALLPATRVLQTGAQKIAVTSDTPTTFDLELYINAAVETPLADTSTAWPLPIDVARVEVVPNVAARYAAIGTSSPRTEETLLLDERFDQGLGGFTIDNNHGQGGGLWHLSTGRRADGDPNHSPPRSLYFGQNESPESGGDYETGSVAEGAVYSPPIDLPSATQITLGFHHFLDTEGFEGFDVAEVAVVTPDATTVVLSSAIGSLPPSTSGAWERATADLTSFAGERVRIEFRFDSVDETANNYEGWFVDDVVILASVVSEPEVDEYTLDLSGFSGDLIDVALSGLGAADFSTASLQIVSADGKQVLARAAGDPSGIASETHDLIIPGFSLAQAGSEDGKLRIRVKSDLAGRYTVVVTQALALENEPNGLDLGLGGLRSLEGTRGALGFLQPGDTPFELVHESDAAAFVDISKIGTPLDLSDDGTRVVHSPYGNEFFPSGPLLISNNGVVLAGSDGFVPYINERLPFAQFGAALVPFWDDLSDSDGTVYAHRTSIDGVNAFIVQWDNRPHFDSLGTVTFQVQILAEGPIPVRYAYRDVVFDEPSLDAGASATAGYQRDSATAIQFSFDMATLAAGDVLSLRRADPSDNYRLDLTAGELATLSLFVPFGGMLGADNGLDARLEVLDPAGEVVAADRGAPHGRDTAVSFVAAVAGAYTVRVLPEAGSGEYVLRVSDAPLEGDFDADGDVDGNDLVTLLLHFGTTSGAMRANGDTDGDGDVDRQDSSRWQQNVGLGTTGVMPSSPTLVPPADIAWAANPASNSFARAAESVAARPAGRAKSSPDLMPLQIGSTADALPRVQESVDLAFAEYEASEYGASESDLRQSHSHPARLPARALSSF